MNLLTEVRDDNGYCLLLGEGNFSFSASLVKRGESIDNVENKISLTRSFRHIYTTCYENEDTAQTEVKTRNINYLQERRVNIIYGVDATRLEEHPVIKNIKFKKVIFMFPHIGGKMKINKNRALLQGILQSAEQVLDDRGHLIITLCKGQGGTPFDSVVRRKDDTWKMLDIAQDNNYIVTEVFKFPSQSFPDYTQVGYRSLQKGFHVEDAVVHVLRPRHTPVFLPLTSMEEVEPPTQLSTFRVDGSVYQQLDMHQPTNCKLDDNQLFPLIHKHHLSFWLAPISPPTNTTTPWPNLDLLRSAANSCLGDIVESVEHLSTYQTGLRSSVTIQVVYKSKYYPVGPKKAFHLHYDVFGKSLVNLFNVQVKCLLRTNWIVF